MKTIKEVREKVGLSQQEMAKYLGISRSMFAMYECGKRSLNPELLVKLIELEAGIHETKEKKVENVFRYNYENEIANAEYKKQQLHYHLARKTQRLEDMKKSYEQNVQLYHVLEYLEAKNYGDTNPWIIQKKNSSENKMLRNDPKYQEDLQNEINAFSAEIESINSWVDSMRSLIQ